MRGRRCRRCRNRCSIHAGAWIGAMRRWALGFGISSRRVRYIRSSSHRTLRIQQMVVTRSQPQADQSARVRHSLRLPAMIGLVAPHGIFTGLIPRAGRFARHIMLAYQRFLNSLRPLRFNLLLPSRGLPFTNLARTRVFRFAAVSGRSRARFRVLVRGRMRCGMSLGRRFGRRFGQGRRARSTTLRRSRSVFLWGCRRALRAASLRVRRGCLPQRHARRSAGTHQRQNTPCAHPFSHFRLMFSFQRQPSEKFSGQCSVSRGQQNP